MNAQQSASLWYPDPASAVAQSTMNELSMSGCSEALPHPSVQSIAKRAIDLTGAGLGLLLLSPFLLIVAGLVRLTSRGPVFFRQTRMGLGGREFRIFKFRTMVADAEKRVGELEAMNESAGGVLFKINRDPRVTPLGRFLRRTSIDELPQLINVVCGDMSLVGPRPLQVRDSERLKALNRDAYDLRLQVLPGVTGPWQVEGRSALDSSAMIQLDHAYVQNWTLTRDMQLLFRTVPVVLAGRGAC